MRALPSEFVLSLKIFFLINGLRMKVLTCRKCQYLVLSSNWGLLSPAFERLSSPQSSYPSNTGEHSRFKAGCTSTKSTALDTSQHGPIFFRQPHPKAAGTSWGVVPHKCLPCIRGTVLHVTQSGSRLALQPSAENAHGQLQGWSLRRIHQYQLQQKPSAERSLQELTLLSI